MKNRRRRAAGRKIKELEAASDKDTTLQTAPEVSACSSRPLSDHEAGMGSLRTSKDDTKPSFELESENGLVRRSVSDHAEDDATLNWRSRSSTDNGSNPSIEKSDVTLPPNMPKTALVPISGMVAAISPVKFSQSFTEPYTAQEHDVWAADSPCPQRSTPSDSTEQQSPEVFIPLSFNTDKDGLMLELNDAAWDHPPLQNGLHCKSGDKFMPFTDAMNEITGFEAVEPSTKAVPGMQPRRDARRQISNESINSNLQEQEEANERIMSAAIMSLSRDKDMEQAYVCILSIISVLQKGGRPLGSSIESARKLLRVMTQPRIAERLGEEIRRQGVLAPGALYSEVYQAMTNAGYPLEQDDHLRVCQFLLDHDSAEDALLCLAKVDSALWTSSTYRTAISCHLFCKPRRLQEAEVLLDRYLLHTRALLLQAHEAKIRPNKDHQEREQASRVMIQKWFRLQLDASKWEETKTLYERRRARLLEAPANIDRFLSSLSLYEMESKPEQAKEAHHACQQIHSGEGSTTQPSSSSTSSSTTVISALNPKSVSTATVDVTPCRDAEVAKEVPAKRRFSFLSAFKSTSSSSSAKSKDSSIAATVPSNINTRMPRSAKMAPNLTPLQTPIGQESIYINRHLTVLDNGMLEECINHKQFEYGWKHVYERMGHARLEDKDTAKIAMRLCKRAFLGHGGLSPHLKGGSSSPNLLARELCFEDDRLSRGEDDREDASGMDTTQHEDETATERDGVLTGKYSGSPTWKKKCEEDAEVWEARAWVIYNKAIMNPFFFSSAGNTPSGSPTQPQQPAAAILAQSTSVGSNAARGSALSLSSPISVMAGTTSLAVFLHNILTVAIHSPERSSRFMKAFKVYSAMRNDPLNKYQAQLRDPFVMTCMFKAIYDTVLAIVKAQSTDQLQTPQMTIGPLMDLAFEIYADMRNVGPIRHLPRLSALAPLTPLPRTPKTPSFVHKASSSTDSNMNQGLSGSMSMFFNLSNRPSTSSSLTTVDLSACGSTDATNSASATSTTTSSTGKTTVSVAPTVQLLLQDLNPTLQPNSHARRLPNELYLALLHLCIQVPLSGLSTSFKVVKTIISDMMSTQGGQQPANMDSHLAAALQFYHDRWMCRPQELKERTRSCSAHNDDSRCENCTDHHGAHKRAERGSAPKDGYEHHDGEDNEDDESEIRESGRHHEGCIYHGWMYQPESYILKHMTPSNTSSTNSSWNDLRDTHFAAELSTTSATEKTASTTAAEAALSSASSTGIDMELSLMENENENSQYGIFKHDADLDELDQYLNARMQPFEKGMQNSKRASDWATTNEQGARAQWIDGLEHDTCNDRFYWDLWSRQDPVLQTVRFSRRRARMLWRHVGSMDM
ncbi:hypothetical protein BGZ68_009529 [Mortierella alpina]|nr:hypothetical protein BGZ68_009529 [Mortierella alpina]